MRYHQNRGRSDAFHPLILVDAKRRRSEILLWFDLADDFGGSRATDPSEQPVSYPSLLISRIQRIP